MNKYLLFCLLYINIFSVSCTNTKDNQGSCAQFAAIGMILTQELIINEIDNEEYNANKNEYDDLSTMSFLILYKDCMNPHASSPF